MDEGSLGGRVEDWVMDRFRDRDTVSRRDLVAESAGSGLPQEVLDAIGELPDAEWAPSGAVHEIVDVLETRAGGGMRGNANVPGAGGYGRSR